MMMSLLGPHPHEDRLAAETRAMDVIVRAARSSSASLTLFHSLGKVLHAKRDEPPLYAAIEETEARRRELQAAVGSHLCPVPWWRGPEPVSVPAREVPRCPDGRPALRGPLRCDPEDVMRSCDGLADVSHYAGFLHENLVKNFYTDMEDTAAVLDYLSDTDLLLNHFPAAAHLQECAGHVAARAVLHCNFHNAPPSFVALHKPANYAARRNHAEVAASILAAAADAHPTADAGREHWGVAGRASLLTEYLPGLAAVDSRGGARGARGSFGFSAGVRGPAPPSSWLRVAESVNPASYRNARAAHALVLTDGEDIGASTADPADIARRAAPSSTIGHQPASNPASDPLQSAVEDAGDAIEDIDDDEE